jgi:hypothetical protein
MVTEIPELNAGVGFEHVYNKKNYTAMLLSCI